MLLIALAIVGNGAALGDHVAMSMGSHPPMEAGLLAGDGGIEIDGSGASELGMTIEQTADVDHPVDGNVTVATHITVETGGQNMSSAWVYQSVPVGELLAEEDTGCGCGMG